MAYTGIYYKGAVFAESSFCGVSPNVYSYHFCSVWVAEWAPFGKELLTRLAVRGALIKSWKLLFPAFSIDFCAQK